MYSEDSFFSLSPAGSAGLAVLSVLLAAGVLWGAWRMMRGRGLGVRGVLALGLFVLFVWLSPQVYYAYYMLLFEGLPLQWVTRTPTLAGLFETVTFTGRANLSAHSKGVLFWALVILAAMPRGPRL